MRNEAALLVTFFLVIGRPLLADPPGRSAGGLPIVKNGRPEAVIVIGTEATPTERHAARELADYVEKMTGARLPVRRVVSGQWPVVSDGRGCVLIGRAETNPLVKQLVDEGVVRLSADEPGSDGYVIQTTDYRPQTTDHDGRWTMDDGRVLVLGGSRDRGTLYAVYDLLARFAHVGFFWDAERIPHLDNFVIPEGTISERPFFRDRSITQPLGGYTVWLAKTFEDWKRLIDWAAKNRLNQVFNLNTPGYFWQVVRARMGIVPEREPTETEKAEIELCRRVLRYFRELDLDPINLNFPYTEVNDEFRKAFPDARYFQSQWLDITAPTYHIFPGDPVYRRYVRTSIEVWREMFPESSHLYYGADAYPEAHFAISQEELREILVTFPRAIMESILEADPKGIWETSGWNFMFDPTVWTKDMMKAFFDNLPGQNYVVWDLACDMNPVYKSEAGNYWYGKPWMFGIIHSMGGDDSLHGDLADTLKRTQSVANDPRADNCVGFTVTAEVMGYCMLYYDFLWRLAWDPRNVTLGDYLEDFALRRYGVEAGPALLPHLKQLQETVYGPGGGSEALYQHRAYPGFYPWRLMSPPQALRTARVLEDLLRALLERRDRLGDQRVYGNDLVDYTRQWLTELFNLQRRLLDNAFTQGDRESFEAESRVLFRLMDAVEVILSSRPEWRVIDVYNHQAESPSGPRDGGKALRDTGLTFAVSYSAIIDYQSKDMYELVRFYYRPRLEAYIRYLKRRLRARDFSVSREDLDKLYRPIERGWVGEGFDPAQAPPYTGTMVEAVASVVDVVANDSEVQAALERFAPREALVNGDFEEGLRGWDVTRTGPIRAEAAEGDAVRGRDALWISLPAEPDGYKACGLAQNLKVGGPFAIHLHYLLRSFSGTANVSLLVEGFDAQGRKRAQAVYPWGGANWDHGDVGPEATGGFYAVNVRQDSATGTWHELTAEPAADVDRVHGAGTWESLAVAQIRMAVNAWAFEKDSNHIEGLVDAVTVAPR